MSVENNLYTADVVRKLDSIAINDFGISGHTLMERAGYSAYNLLRRLRPNAKSIAIFVGSGNNGGDGYVLAKFAVKDMATVVYQVGSKKLQGDAKAAQEDAKLAGVVIEPYNKQELDVDIIVDAMLGTGFNGELQDPWAAVCMAINNAAKFVLALDIPTGLQADTGHVVTTAVKADATITFIGQKQGLYTGLAANFCGDIYFASLEVPQEVYIEVPVAANLLDLDLVLSQLPRILPAMHKGDCGHVLVVGGASGMLGAAIMAATSAMRANAGLVTIATISEHKALVAIANPVVMATDDIALGLAKADVVLIGPGLGQLSWSREILAAVLATKLPLVVDADALNLLAQEPCSRDNWILTPHPKEAARLLGCEVIDVVADRYAAAKEISKRYGGVVVLKGAGTVIAYNDKIEICGMSCPGLATAGMGDVLGGIIAANLPLSKDLAQAARSGVCLHMAAGQELALSGTRGIIATDMFSAIKLVLTKYEEKSA